MWPWILAAVAIVVGMFLLPAVLERMPRSKQGGGGLGAAMIGMNTIFNPAEQHVEAARRQLPADRTNDEPEEDPDAEEGAHGA